MLSLLPAPLLFVQCFLVQKNYISQFCVICSLTLSSLADGGFFFKFFVAINRIINYCVFCIRLLEYVEYFEPEILDKFLLLSMEFRIKVDQIFLFSNASGSVILFVGDFVAV